jgi:aspartyl-tRNA(Asn)/glutamyl-tRNA(Gln) amidotransferase subunit C
MPVSVDDVRKIAALARVGVDEARLPGLVQELSGILGHMTVLERVDITGVDRTGGASAAPLREDAGPAIPLAEALGRFAPQMRDGFFMVPRLATHEDLGAAEQE